MYTSAADSVGLCVTCEAGPCELTWRRCPACWAAVVDKRGARMVAGPTALYRLFNTYADRLYIGTTVDLKVRFNSHRRRMPWWYQVDHERTTVEWLDCGHVGALGPENDAVRTELPWYNRSGIPVVTDENGKEHWPNLPPGCPPQPWYTHRPYAEYRQVWHEWYVVFRELMLNPEERATLGRLPGAGAPDGV